MVEETTNPRPRAGAQPEYLTVTSGLPQIRAVGMDAPWRWLRAGWRDFRAATGTSLFYGVALRRWASCSRRRAGAIEIAFLTGFLLVGPFLAWGLRHQPPPAAGGRSRSETRCRLEGERGAIGSTP
jgi:uncharacterized membrane protein